MPAVSSEWLIVMGTPCSGPSVSPRARLASAAFAAREAIEADPAAGQAMLDAAGKGQVTAVVVSQAAADGDRLAAELLEDRDVPISVLAKVVGGGQSARSRP